MRIIIRGANEIEIVIGKVDTSTVETPDVTKQSSAPADVYVSVNPSPPASPEGVARHERQGDHSSTSFERPGDTETPGAASSGTMRSCTASSTGSPPAVLPEGPSGQVHSEAAGCSHPNILTDDASVSALMKTIGAAVQHHVEHPPAPVEPSGELPLKRYDADADDLAIPDFLDRRKQRANG